MSAHTYVHVQESMTIYEIAAYGESTQSRAILFGIHMPHMSRQPSLTCHPYLQGAYYCAITNPPPPPLPPSINHRTSGARDYMQPLQKICMNSTVIDVDNEDIVLFSY